MSNLVRTYFRRIGPIAHLLCAALAVLAGLWAYGDSASYIHIGRWVLAPFVLVLTMTIPLRLFVVLEDSHDGSGNAPSLRLVVDNTKVE